MKLAAAGSKSSVSSDEMSYLEALMWKGEDDPRMRWSGAVVLRLDQTPDWEQVRVAFERTSRSFVRLRQRILMPPMNLGKPRWVVDPHFDLNYHLRRCPLPGPGTVEQLLEVVAVEMMSGFDRGRSPWRAGVVEHMEDGGAAIVVFLNHAVIDGIGAMRLFGELFDLQRAPATDRVMPDLPAPSADNEMTLLREALHPAATVGRTGHLLAGALTGFGRALARPGPTINGAAAFTKSLLATATETTYRSPLMGGRSGASRLAVHELPLAAMKAVARSTGTTLNDVYFAGLAGGLGQYHAELGSPLDELSIGFPISNRKDADSATGNHFTSSTIALPLGLKDPLERLQKVHERAVLAKSSESAITSVLPAVYFAPTWLLTPLMKAGIAIEFGCSNVPGLPVQPFIGGAQVDRFYGFAPHPGTALMVSLVSHAGTCCLAYNLDPAAVTDIDCFIRCQRESFEALLALSSSAVS
jgi:diacylglycerol O-acyltransferase